MNGLTKKEQSKLRRLLREFSRAKTNGWECDMEILEAEMKPLLDKQLESDLANADMKYEAQTCDVEEGTAQ